MTAILAFGLACWKGWPVPLAFGMAEVGCLAIIYIWRRTERLMSLAEIVIPQVLPLHYMMLGGVLGTIARAVYLWLR